MTRKQTVRIANRSLFYFVLALALIYTIFPFYWALNGSFQPETQITATPADYLAVPGATATHYKSVFTNRDFLLSLRNSAIVAGGTTILALGVGALAACALGRYKMRGRQAIMGLVLSMTMFPQISVVGAVKSTISSLGLFNSLGGLILSYMLFTLPFTIWVMTSFFKSLPRELEESAYVDGASPLQTFWRILLPLSLPGLATTGLLAFIAAWNEYLFALTLTITNESRTVPVVIANFGGDSLFSVPWGSIMAACVVVTLPLVVLVLIFQRHIVAGMTAGAVKG
ncbi:MAG: carbohydrate ABC transporter permease [Sumerlaeia bacterium]